MSQAHDSLTPGGYLIIEADPTQHDSLIEYAKKLSFSVIRQIGYVIAFKLKRKNN